MKTYEIHIIKPFMSYPFINHNNQYDSYYHVIDYWESLGGTYSGNVVDYIYGTDEILIEFMLTYPHAQWVTLKEVILPE